MIAWLRRTMVAGVVLLVAAGVWAGEPAVEAGPKEAEFERLFAEWKGTLDQLHVLRDQYRRAQPGRREGLPERYAELLSQGEREFSALKVAAEAACLEDPGVNLLPADFLAATIDLDCNNDAYEEAFRMAKILVDHGFDQRGPGIYAGGGIAAFASSEFDLAEKWLRAAKDKNVFAHIGPPWRDIGPVALRMCPACRDAWAKEESLRAAEAKADWSPELWLPRVLLRTTEGEIELELFENEAPNTVANFIALVEAGAYSAEPSQGRKVGGPLSNFYNVVRVQQADAGGYVAPDGNVFFTRLEGCDQPQRSHFRGSVTATEPADGHGGGTSQFSILLFPMQGLNGKNTCFGRVVRGMEVVSQLQRVTPESLDVEADKILEAKVLRKRDHAYELRKPPPKP